MLVADLAQPFEIALGRHQYAGRAGDRLDETGGDALRPVEVDEALEIVGQVGALLRLPARETCVRRPGVAQMRDPRHHRAERVAVAHHAAQADAADIDAVIGALAADEPGALPLALGGVIGHRDLERGVDRLGSGVAEEHVIEIAGRDLRHLARQFERGRMAKLEMRRVVDLLHGRVDGVGDLGAAVAGGAAEQAGRRVDQLVALVVPVMHALGLHHQARIGLEITVGREGHPMVFERICGVLHGS